MRVKTCCVHIPRIAEGVSLATANNADYFSYASTGLGRGNVGGAPAISQVIMCDKRGLVETSKDNSAGRLFVATPLGRASDAKGLLDGQ